MSETQLRVVRSSEIEREEDEEGFSEVLRPSLSGVPDVWFSRFGTFRGAQIPAHYHTTNSIAYLVRGRAVFRTGENFEVRHEMSAGDYVTVPRGVHHMEETLGEETAEFVFVRDGGGGETVYLDAAPPQT